MKTSSLKYSNRKIMEKIVLNDIPDALERDFKSFNGPDKTTIKEVQEALLNIELCKDLGAKHNSKKEDGKKGKKYMKEEDEKGKKNSGNLCCIEGHNHDWKDCPENWRNKKEKEKEQKQENNNIEVRKKGATKESKEVLQVIPVAEKALTTNPFYFRKDFA